MSPVVVWRRQRIEPPEVGPCEEPACRTLPLGLDEPLLVAVYSYPDGRVIRVCAPCDWLVLEHEVELDR